MSLFKRRVKVSDVYVITALVILSYKFGTACGPQCVTMYFLAKRKHGEWYELFSGKKLETEKQSVEGAKVQMFDTPYVQTAKPLTNYIIDPYDTVMDIQSLFAFITRMNALGMLGAFEESDD